MNTLPNEIILKIFGHCDGKTIYKLSLLCKKIRSLLKSNRSAIRGFFPVQDLHINFDTGYVRLSRILPQLDDVIPVESPQFEFGKLGESKKIEWSGATARLIWEHIWYMDTATIRISIKDERFAEIMEQIPYSWLARIYKVLLYSAIPCDILPVLCKLKECNNYQIQLEDSQSDVNTMLRAVKKIRVFELKGNIQKLTCDDETLEMLAAKSNVDLVGLEHLSIYPCQHKYSFEKVKQFLKTSKFVPRELARVHLHFGSIECKTTEFLVFLQEEKADFKPKISDFYHFIMNNTEFVIRIDNFIE